MHKKIIQLVVLSIIVVYPTSCTYSLPKTRVSIENMSRKPDSYSFAVVLKYTKYKDPTGFINTFPNGGVQMVLDESVQVYLCNAMTREATLLTEIKAPFMELKGLKPWLGGWDKDSFYFSLEYGQSWEIDYKKFYFKMTQNGSFQQVHLNALPNKPGQSLVRMQGEKNYLRLSTDYEPISITARMTDSGDFLPIFIIDKENRTIVPVNN